MLKLPLLLLLTLALAACSGDEEPATPEPAPTPEPAAAPTPAPTPEPAAAAPTAAQASAYTLVSLESGDHACYVNVKDASGAESSFPGDFEVCPGGGSDASAFIGKPVELVKKPGKMAADSCQGDPECKDTKDVELVVGIRGTP